MQAGALSRANEFGCVAVMQLASSRASELQLSYLFVLLDFFVDNVIFIPPGGFVSETPKMCWIVFVLDQTCMCKIVVVFAEWNNAVMIFV